MRFLLLLVLGLVFLLPACFSEIVEKKEPVTFLEKLSGVTDKPVMICTPYGDIAKDSLTVMVMDLWGNPDHISSEGKDEVWSYCFGGDKYLFIYFFNGKVKKVAEKEEAARREDDEE